MKAISTVLVASLYGVIALEDYVIPSIDFPQLASSSSEAVRLLEALRTDGIVGLKKIPQYKELRTLYLEQAAQCALDAQTHDADFLLHRTLQDGTKRYTISTESGRELLASGKETMAYCPEYLPVYQEFSQLVEDTVARVGNALDNAGLVVHHDEELSVSELMENSVHLDHFHAYEAATTAISRRQLEEKNVNRVDEESLSLPLHTDNGLMIAMSAPAYFDVLSEDAKVQVRKTDSQDAGLVIATADGTKVRPLLQADELVLMMGSGIDQWIQTTPRLHPVLHGMKYPRSIEYADDNEASRVVRAWFGKMMLLANDHKMANTNMSYGEFANKTTRYLLEQQQDTGFAAIACPLHRHLAASDSKCLARDCTAKPDPGAEKLEEPCSVLCNHKDKEADCVKYCTCQETTAPGTVCWMLCVADLPEAQCANQKCNDAASLNDMAMICDASSTSSNATTVPTPTPTKANNAAGLFIPMPVGLVAACLMGLLF